VLARVTGFFWMLCVVGGIYGYFPGKGTHLGKEALLVAGAAYLVVTVLLYVLLRPVNSTVAALAAGFGVVGIATSGDGSFYFGIQCVLLGYLVWNSEFLPRTLGALMVLAGVAQLLFFSTLFPELASSRIASIGYFVDGAGEIALALWLLVFGVSETAWRNAHVRQAV